MKHHMEELVREKCPFRNVCEPGLGDPSICDPDYVECYLYYRYRQYEINNKVQLGNKKYRKPNETDTV